LTSFKVVLAGEIRGLLVYAGVFCQRHMHQYTRGFSESVGGTARHCVDEPSMLGVARDAPPWLREAAWTRLFRRALGG